MLLAAMLAGFWGQAATAPPTVPVMTREEVERAAPDHDQRRFTSRKKHSLGFIDGPGCTVELAHENPKKVIVDDDGIEIRDEPAPPAQPDAPKAAEVAPVSSCSPR